eukprot:scaffold43130_cov73-Phaeocystis_antarctica.AAC.2
MRDRRPALHAAHRKGRASHTKRRWLADSIHLTSQLPINTCMVVYQRAPERHPLAKCSVFASVSMPAMMPAACRLALCFPPSLSEPDRSCRPHFLQALAASCRDLYAVKYATGKLGCVWCETSVWCF